MIEIQLIPASDYDREQYGVTYRSALVYKVKGKGVHNRSFPHRVNVWSNVNRLNRTPEQWNEYSGKPGPGRYLDPNNKGTDEATSVLLSSESICIDNYGTGTGSPGSGQQWANDELIIGDTVRLVYPDGDTIEMTVTARYASDTVLVPAPVGV